MEALKKLYYKGRIKSREGGREGFWALETTAEAQSCVREAMFSRSGSHILVGREDNDKEE